MNIVVCMKMTFDTEEKIVLKDGRVQEDGAKFVINPYDEYAVEEALRQREAAGGIVTVITLGPARAESALRTALAMGADQAIHIMDDRLDEADEYVTSQVLAKVIGRHPFDLVLAGYMAVDSGAAQGGPRLAELLDIPHISTVVQLNIQADGHCIALRDAEGDTERIEARLPLLVTTQQGLNDPRYPSLPGIMKAKKKTIERLNCTDLGLVPDELENRTQIVSRSMPAARQAGRKLQGTKEETARELIDLLRNERKVI